MHSQHGTTAAEDLFTSLNHRGSRSAGAAATTTTAFSTSNKNIRSTSAGSNHRNLIDRTGTDVGTRDQGKNCAAQEISISPKDDKDLFSDVEDSSDDEADISRLLQQERHNRHKDVRPNKDSHKDAMAVTSSSLGNSSSPNIPISHHATSASSSSQLPSHSKDINFETQSVRGCAGAQTNVTSTSTSTTSVKPSRGPLSDVEIATPHPNGQQTKTQKTSTRKAASSISRVVAQHPKTSSSSKKKKPRKKLVLTNSRKRRMKLIAKKSVLEQQRLNSLLSNQELKCSTGDCRVRDLEKFHYGKNGQFLSGSKIPAIFTNKIATEDAKGSWKAIFCTTDLSLRSGMKFPSQYSWTDDATTSCLEELGWNHNPRLHQFTLNENDQVLQLSMDRIRAVVNRVKDRLPVYEQGIGLDPTVFGKMEEEILLQKIQHDIDILASVQDTFYVSDVSTPVQNSCLELSTGDEHMDFSNSNSHQEELEDIQDVTTNIPSGVSQERMLKAKNVAPKLCKITKYFPKFVGDSNELLLTEQILAYFSRPKLKITLKEHTEDNDTSAVILCGLKDDIDAALKNIVTVIQKKIVHYNCDLLHSHKDRIEVDVKFDITQELGVKTVKATKSIWIQNVTSGGQFEQIFGSRLGGGAAIVSMGFLKSGAMEPIFSNKSKNAFLRRAKEALYRDDKESNKWIIVRICMLKDDKIDIYRALMAANRLVHQSKSNLWQNGKSKRMVKPSHKASEEESKVSIDTSSMSRKRKQPSPRSESTSGSPSEEVSRKKLDLKDRSIAPKAITDKDSSYRHFRDKTQPVREIEFKSRMNGHAACGSMWMQHKKLFGEHCDPNCNCVSEMDKLVANIVLEGKSLETRDKIGFADSFCPRFFDKVRKYFPKDSAEQVLSKLVEMWKLGHIKQRTLGGSCDASCSCGNLWSLLFLPICRGDLPQKSDLKQFGNSHNKENINEENTIFDITFCPSTSSLGFYCETKVCDKSKQVCVVRSVDPGKKAVSKITPGTIIECYTLGQQTVRVSTHHQLERVYNILKTRGDKSPITLRFKKKELSDEKTIDCSRDWSKTNAWIGGSSNQGWAGGAMVIKGRTGYNHATGNSAKDSAKALKHRERFLPQSAKETIREKMKGSKICGKVVSAPNPNGAKSANGESSDKISGNGDVGTKMKPLRLDSVAPLKRKAQYVGKATEPSRLAINYPTKLQSKYPSKSKVCPPKSILRTDRQNTQNRSKVTFDLSRNLVNTYIPDTYISIAPENKGVKFTEEKLTEAIMCGQHLERFVEMLKHCVHDFKYETPLQTLANRIKELNEENENLTKENLSSAEMSERKLQIEKDLHQFDMKKKIVKIYAKAHQLLRTIGNSTPDVIKIGIIEHVESHSIEITKQIITLYDWLMRFRDEASEAGITLNVDANVDVYGVSLAHAAVFVGDSNLLQTLIKSGAQMKTSKSLGTPHQLAQFLLNQALMKGNLTWTKKYMKVISVLENIRSQN